MVLLVGTNSIVGIVELAVGAGVVLLRIALCNTYRNIWVAVEGIHRIYQLDTAHLSLA